MGTHCAQLRISQPSSHLQASAPGLENTNEPVFCLFSPSYSISKSGTIARMQINRIILLLSAKRIVLSVLASLERNVLFLLWSPCSCHLLFTDASWLRHSGNDHLSATYADTLLTLTEIREETVNSRVISR